MPEQIPSVQQLVKSYEAKQHKLNTTETKGASGINTGQVPHAPDCGQRIGAITGLPKKKGNPIYEHS
jgi:hypothetical protein